ncbi:amino acid permease [Telmatospirillum sp.]|uniref:amino acid permease n=1 Tax=Telmatospirillum sp. TaxID=2079197 RepID=UPI0028496527|nr:amino acid permease [Telmatospirillum sp.]MDR3435569.1 amino acid permease [Telmatospirillum sp.]
MSSVFKEDLRRGLKERHIQLIALGGAIGVGLFYGSAGAIQMAGPLLLISYMVGGVAMFFMMRALGEVALAYPVSGSFSAYAHRFISPLFGYLTGWTYWFAWIVTCMAEITAVGVYTHFWWPDLPQWIPALVAVVCMSSINFLAVGLYGEFEFWFALIKVCTIVAMLVLGGAMILFGLGNGGIAIGISNLWTTGGGFFAKGFSGFTMSLVIVSFAYIGIELVGVTAGEAQNPDKSLPRAIDKIFWRILVFYVGALFVIMSLYPYDQIGTIGSPFVATFSKLGIPAAAGIINFVVLTAALSSCNSGIFSTGRMLYNLSQQGRAPAAFGKLNKRKLPINALVVSSLMMLVGVALNYLVPSEVFTYVTSIATSGTLFTWGIIVVVQMRYRRSLTSQEVAKLKYKMPFYPIANYMVLGFLVFVACAMAFDENNRIALYVAPVWVVLLLASYYGAGYHRKLERVESDDLAQSCSAEQEILSADVS